MTKEEAKEFIAQSVKSDVDMAKVADAINTLEQEPITKNDVPENNVGKIEPITKNGFIDNRVIESFKDRINDYEKDYKFSKEELINILERYELKYAEPTTKNDLGIEKIIDEVEKEFEKVDIPIMDKLTIFAKVQNALYKYAISNNSLRMIRPKGHWIDKFGGVYRCSYCREVISIDTEIEFPNGITYKYCPYCGSKNSVKIADELAEELEQIKGTTKNDLGVDAVSREKVYYMITNGKYPNEDYEQFIDRLVNELAELPSVTPQESRWIPCSERLPKDSEPVNIIWILHDHAPCYNDIRDKAFTATGVYSNGQWYWWSKSCTDILEKYSHNYADILYEANKAELEAWMPHYDDIINESIEVVAWMALPKKYSEVEV